MMVLSSRPGSCCGAGLFFLPLFLLPWPTHNHSGGGIFKMWVEGNVAVRSARVLGTLVSV